MQEQMQVLKDLQELDQELNKLRQSRGKLEAEESSLEADLNRVLGMVESLAADMDQIQTQRRELSQGQAQEDENIKRAEGRLPAIKTQKEYLAVLKEIDSAKKVKKDLLDRIQEKDRDLEALGREKEEKEGELSSLREKVEGRRAEIGAVLAEFDEQLGTKGAKKDDLLSRLPQAIRKRYQMLMERRGGIAVVEARNGACLGCNMHLPPQLFNSLLRHQEIQSCPHCHRLLFVQSA